MGVRVSRIAIAAEIRMAISITDHPVNAMLKESGRQPSTKRSFTLPSACVKA
jgi:hypothetical protein